MDVLHFRRFASLLVGVWLAGSVAIDLVAVQNFKSVERFLAGPGVFAAQDIHTLGQTEARLLLRHLVAEQNRFYFEQWEWIQLAVGLGLLSLLVFGARPPKFPILLVIAMLIIILVQRVALTPQITNLGRALDFIPAATRSAERDSFWMFHGIYSAVELLKITAGLLTAALLIVRRNDPNLFARESALDEVGASRRIKTVK